MGKYIDADLLRKEIEKHIKEVKDAAKRFTPDMGFFDAKLSGIYDVMAIIDSLQQEQPESLKGKFVFPNFLYARTVDNKTIDVSYAPQSLDAIEYIRKDIVDETIKTAEDHAYFAGQEKFREKLIEWASKSLGQVSDMGFDDGDVEHGYTRALQDIIEHLNKM